MIEFVAAADSGRAKDRSINASVRATRSEGGSTAGIVDRSESNWCTAVVVWEVADPAERVVCIGF
jgi:hypothetical protein